MKADHRYIDHRQQHKRVYSLDQDYADVLEGNIRWKSKRRNCFLFSFTQNSKWKIEWNNYIGGIHSSDSERKRRIQWLKKRRRTNEQWLNMKQRPAGFFVRSDKFSSNQFQHLSQKNLFFNIFFQISLYILK